MPPDVRKRLKPDDSLYLANRICPKPFDDQPDLCEELMPNAKMAARFYDIMVVREYNRIKQKTFEV
jgi:hypothetical protein